jgi:hypothetical protein
MIIGFTFREMQQENNSGEAITPSSNNLISNQKDLNGESKNAAAIEDMPTTTQKQSTFKKGHRRARSMPSHQVAKNGPKNFGHEQSVPNQV